MSFIISGDTHGTLDIKKVIDFFEGKDNEYTEDDYLIILGDDGPGLCIIPLFRS